MPQTIGQLVLGELQTNCYLCQDGDSGDGFILDPAVFHESILSAVEQMKISNLRYILLTHGHFDHILGVNDLKSRFPEAEIIAPLKEKEFFSDPFLSLSSRFGADQDPIPVDRWVVEGDRISFGDTELRVLETPGHTAGSICYIMDTVLFSGDTLFRDSMGITTHPTGDEQEELLSLQKLKELPGDYSVLPGHGPATTLQREREHNIYMRTTQW